MSHWIRKATRRAATLRQATDRKANCRSLSSASPRITEKGLGKSCAWDVKTATSCTSSFSALQSQNILGYFGYFNNYQRLTFPQVFWQWRMWSSDWTDQLFRQQTGQHLSMIWWAHTDNDMSNRNSTRKGHMMYQSLDIPISYLSLWKKLVNRLEDFFLLL